MAVLARLWFHFCSAGGWFPAEQTGLLLTAIEKQGFQSRHQRENNTKEDY
jgi:hypothetical protein